MFNVLDLPNITLSVMLLKLYFLIIFSVGNRISYFLTKQRNDTHNTELQRKPPRGKITLTKKLTKMCLAYDVTMTET